MVLDSTTTFTQAVASYKTNASYEEEGSVSKAKAFITAVRHLLITPQKINHSNREELEHNMVIWREELKAAQQFVARDSGSVRHYDLSEFRR